VTLHTEAFVGPLAREMTQFVAHKRALGRRYDTEVYALRLFDRYLVTQAVGTIAAVGPAVIKEFLATRPRKRPRSYNHLLGVLRQLFQWLADRGYVDRSPVSCPIRRGGVAPAPFILAPEAVRRLLDRASQLRDFPGVADHRGPTYHAIFAILYGLGLRVGEVSRLDIVDVDQERKLLVIRDTKFGKDRLVPFGPRLGAVLRRYLDTCCASEAERGDAASAPLFVGRYGGRLGRHQIGRVFRSLLPELGLNVPKGMSPPHLHDLRHSFAVGTLLRWYRAGIDPAQRILQLSVFMGHVQPESTAIYLTITSDLLAEAGKRFESLTEPLVDRRQR
jgi:site-specific recombinase XerD